MEENECKCGRDDCDGAPCTCGDGCGCNKPKTKAEECLELGVAPV